MPLLLSLTISYSTHMWINLSFIVGLWEGGRLRFFKDYIKIKLVAALFRHHCVPLEHSAGSKIELLNRCPRCPSGLRVSLCACALNVRILFHL